jgi:hypothetical protein
MAQPSVVLLFAVVGLAEVLHAIPLTVTVEPPFEVIVPPLAAVDEVILETAFVVIPVGIVLFSEQLVSLVPPFEPLHAQVQEVDPSTLLALVPEVQL